MSETWAVSRDQTDPLDPNQYVHRDGQGRLSVSDRPMLFRNQSVAKKMRQRINRQLGGGFVESPYPQAPGVAADPFTARYLPTVKSREWDWRNDITFHIPEFGTPGNSA